MASGRNPSNRLPARRSPETSQNVPNRPIKDWKAGPDGPASDRPRSWLRFDRNAGQATLTLSKSAVPFEYVEFFKWDNDEAGDRAEQIHDKNSPPELPQNRGAAVNSSTFPGHPC